MQIWTEECLSRKYLYFHINVLINKYTITILSASSTRNHWNNEPLKHWIIRNYLQNTVIANWSDKYEPNWLWDMSCSARWILTANLLIDEVMLLWLSHLTFFFLSQANEKISTCGCDLFNYLVIKWVTFTGCTCLNWSCTQRVCDMDIIEQLSL